QIDLPATNTQRVKREIEEIIGLDTAHAVLDSAKEGVGTEEVLERIVRHFPPPRGDAAAPLRALMFDSWFDPYHGVVVVVRVFDGSVRKGSRILLMASGTSYEVTRVGVLGPRPQ